MNPSQILDKTHTNKELVLDQEGLERWVRKLENADIFAFDTETNGTFDRFAVEMVGISLAVDDEACYIPVGHYDKTQQLFLTEVIEALKPFLEDPSKEKVCHNAKFDEMVVEKYGVRVQGPTNDTMVLAWMLNEETRALKPLVLKYLDYKMETYEEVVESAPRKKGEARDYNFAKVPLENAISYAADDSLYTLKLFYKLREIAKARKIWGAYENVERPILRVARQMETRGINVDKELITKADENLPGLIDKLEGSIYRHAGKKFNVNSGAQLATVLYDELKITDKPPRTKKGTRITSAKALEKYEALHPIVGEILSKKKLQKLHSTFVKGYANYLAKDGRIHPQFNSIGTRTGRFSSKEPNFQNVVNSEVADVKARNFFIPTEGGRFVVADYSQIELRIIAHFARDEVMMAAFDSGHDFHTETGNLMSKLSGKQIPRVVAKAINFGVAYGRQAPSIGDSLGIPVEQAQEFIDTWHETYFKAAAYKEYVQAQARKDGFVRTISGKQRWLLPDIQARAYWIRQHAERQAFNTVCQGSAGDIMKIAMIALQPKLDPYNAYIIIQVHDELVIDTPKECAEDVAHTVQHVMENPLKGKNPLRLPLVAEPKIVDHWSEAK